ncbi:transmembrane protein 26b [Tachysurus fulvidraco]|uniref:transmembrane protein 26b n=1 Tax=Tachysurus fulvidraco TaxID=1234273 RepID=UPI001FEDA9D8|nr:transmembrane protein 26b [Tachysurus fulvidraco]
MLLKFICALVTRSLFILISLIGMWRVIWVKNNQLYWFLTILFLPLVVEMLLTLRSRQGNQCKWFSPAIFLFLVSIIPSIWILELHHRENKHNNIKCNRLNSSENIKELINTWKTLNSTNVTAFSKIFQGSEKFLSSVCPNDWILALHQAMLVLLILGKWLLPNEGGLTRDQLSQLLLIFVGTAADILEFTSETLSDVSDKSPVVVYIILAIWTWSMLQFPHNLTVLNPNTEEYEAEAGSLLSKHRTDFWSVIEALLIQDGPFLLVRLTVMIHFEIVHQMLVFFAIKNFLVVALSMYRLWVICFDSRA